MADGLAIPCNRFAIRIGEPFFDFIAPFSCQHGIEYRCQNNNKKGKEINNNNHNINALAVCCSAARALSPILRTDWASKPQRLDKDARRSVCSTRRPKLEGELVASINT